MSDGLISQDEIDALLNSNKNDNNADSPQTKSNDIKLTSLEQGAIGEYGNITMKKAASTLSDILDKKTTINAPDVQVLTIEDIKSKYNQNYIAVKVDFTKGIQGLNYLVLEEKDVKVITDLMMGGDGSNTTGDISELHLSAIGEAMNQMIGSAATSLAKVFKNEVDISPPKAYPVSFAEGESFLEGFENEEKLVCVIFNLKVEGMIKSNVIQIISLPFAKELGEKMLGMPAPSVDNKKPETALNQPPTNEVKAEQTEVKMPTQPIVDEVASPPQMQTANVTAISNSGEGNSQGVGVGTSSSFVQQPTAPNKQPVDVQPVNFQSFEDGKVYLDKKNVDLIMDVPLQVTVELGRTRRLIKDILEYGSGSIIELDKLAEEPVDILVNGKIVARGEVVVIDESFGVRITEIIQGSLNL